jgi:hypothetical protein
VGGLIAALAFAMVLTVRGAEVAALLLPLV